MTPEIKLKLVSGSKVILADCLGYESELFVPVIINKRIVLQNAVVSRRCCNQDFFGSGNPLEKCNSSNDVFKKLYNSQKVPLANSTPTHILKPCKENISNSIESYPCPKRERSSKMNVLTELTIKPFRRSSHRKMPDKIARIIPTPSSQASKDTCSSMNNFPSPDIVRRAPLQNAHETIPLPVYPQVTQLKIVRLHRVHTPNTPKSLAKIVRSKTPLGKTSSPQVLRDIANLSSFGSPPSLNQTKEPNSFHCGTPNQSFLVRRINTPGSVTKWRKCITPKRTYIRNSNGQKILANTTSLQPLQLAKNGKLVESYRIPNRMKNQIIIKRRKLIIDTAMKISPNKFKKQLTNTEDLNRCKYQLPKSRKHFYYSQMTAFDLITNSSFYPKIGNKLNAVFRQGCVNKHAATVLKYKQLTKDIPLHDV